MESGYQSASLEFPLLQNSGQDGTKVDIEQNKKGVIERTHIIEEVKKQLWLAGPLIFVNVLSFCIQVISVMFVGHLGELPLAGASMANSFSSVTGISLLLGMSTALDTFCGQSYGAKQHRMLGIHMQRAMLVLMIVCIPITIIWANTRSILIFLGQDPEISAEAGRYAQASIPALFAFGLLDCLVRFLQTQNIVFPMMFSTGITTLLHFFVCWILVFKSGLGSRGAAISNCIAYWANVLILILYVKYSSSCAQTWTGFSKEALRNIPSFLSMAIPSAAMVCLEMWAFEVLVLLSGLLPNPKLQTSVISICMNTQSIALMVPLGFSESASIRVSNELGASLPWAARLAVYVVLVMVLIEGTLVGTVMVLLRNIWGYSYSNEVEVVEYIAIMFPLLAISHFMDGIQCVLSGTARGCGLQKIGAYINLGSYYLVGVPSAILLGFVLHLGGKGLWLGIICAGFVQVLSLVIVIARINWEQEAKNATKRVNDSVIPEIVS
ncbi:hypothetical protein RIF29_35123 [Crotalaria pallida]|uniref:Protein DETOXIFICATION n=1 Tax=Crotalaria pallida TaxID=3830 RepID=A0AAN9E9U9_CROPI